MRKSANIWGNQGECRFVDQGLRFIQLDSICQRNLVTFKQINITTTSFVRLQERIAEICRYKHRDRYRYREIEIEREREKQKDLKENTCYIKGIS